MKMKGLGILATLILVSNPAYARDIYLTPYIGYTMGGAVQDTDGNDYDLNGSESIAFSVETPYEAGRIGMFYSYQQTEVEKVGNEADIHYLMFQSSIYYEMSPDLESSLGLGLGGSYNNVDWADNKYGWAVSAYAGLNYRLSDSLYLNTHVRWLGTAVDADSSAQCNLPTNNGSCRVQFDTDWQDQVSANVGLSWRF